MAATSKPSLAGPTRPLGAREIPQFHLRPAPGATGVYAPWVYGAATVQFVDRKRTLDETRRVAFRVPLTEGMRLVDWELAAMVAPTPDLLLGEAPVPAPYRPLPAGAMDLKIFTRWAKSFDRWLARTQRLAVPVAEGDAPVSIAPKRGGVSVELVAIAWELA